MLKLPYLASAIIGVSRDGQLRDRAISPRVPAHNVQSLTIAGQGLSRQKVDITKLRDRSPASRTLVPVNASLIRTLA